MRKVKVIVKEIRIEEVEYICEVDEKDLKENGKYGIGEIESLGDMSNGGGDAMGIYCKDVSRKEIDGSIDSKFYVIGWKEVGDFNNPKDIDRFIELYNKKEEK